MNATEKMMWSTYPLGTEKGEATGFVINRRNADTPGGKEAVVFTSSHVLDTLGNGPLLVVLRTKEEGGAAAPLFLVLIPPKKPAKSFYVSHPDHDIAAFTVRLPAELAEIAEMRSFLHEGMLGRDGRSLHSGVEVAFLGYPDVMPGTEGAFPVLRSGRVASYPVGTAQARGRFLINSDVYPGDSGAPVILAGANGQPRLVGMIIQRIGPESRSFSHLAVAVDADVIRETLQLLAESEKAPVQAQGPAPAKPGF
ncbi:MAG: trypsin-like peptidase domain-containing protein [Verrucomicrobiaceae bacterium]|nr:trypsin-like peptidase domain-containing protein [Verrucomicrobiaceae bacterium]